MNEIIQASPLDSPPIVDRHRVGAGLVPALVRTPALPLNYTSDVARPPVPALVRKLHYIALLSIVLACLGMSWFAFQVFFVPQPKSFAPDWHGANWVQAADSHAPVVYFRSLFNVNTRPDAAFITIQASQKFYLFLDGLFIGTNNLALKQGDYLQVSMYSVTSLIQSHANVIAVRVANDDKQAPLLRLSLGIVNGKTTTYYGTGSAWQATGDDTLVYPHNTASLDDSTFWTTATFDSSAWVPVQAARSVPASASLNVDPQIYVQPMSDLWMSAGLSHDAFFVRQISLPAGVNSAWLRIVASGTASIYINNQLLVVWDGRPPALTTNLASYYGPALTAPYTSGFATGVYDISPYLHPGTNVIAAHVAAPGASAILNGLNTLNASLSLDVLVNDAQDHTTWIMPGSGWHVSPRAVEGWQQGASLAWFAPVLVNRVSAARLYYQPDSSSAQNVAVTPLSPLLGIALYSVAVIAGLWLLVSLFFKRRYQVAGLRALELTSLAYLPALACEGLLMTLSFEPHMPRPFPYTANWAIALLLLVVVGYLLLWRHVHSMSGMTGQRKHDVSSLATSFSVTGIKSKTWMPGPASGRDLSHHYSLAGTWLRTYWPLLLILLLATPLVMYNLGYDPYWQDELTSYYAARGVLAHGLPIMPSGFLYTKGELYSYALALDMLIFGDQGGAPRILSALEFLACIPALYVAGRYFFNRRVALLATALFAFSPIALGWGREMRMYQQAQLLTIVALYLFYRALQERQRVHLVYFAVACLVAAYLSHEESFIIFPALFLWVVVASRDEKHRYFAALYQKHWWIAGALGAGIVISQLLIASITHPSAIGTDSSQRPFLQLGTDSIPYYTKLLFLPWMLDHGTLSKQLPFQTLHSLLAALGCYWAVRRHDRRATFCAWFLVSSLLTLVLVFTMQSDRYLYPLLPVYYLMTAYALQRMLRALWIFAHSRAGLTAHAQHNQDGDRLRLSPVGFLKSVSVPDCHSERSEESQGASGILRFAQNDRHGGLEIAKSPVGLSPTLDPGSLITAMMAFTIGLVCICMLVVPILPVANYNLLVSRLAGFSYQRQHPDYDAAGRYIHDHWRKGDIVIALGPSLSVLYYIGQVDYFFSTDRALYLFERNGSITDTPTGTTPILSQDDFQAVLASHSRIWIVANGSFQNQTRVQINGKIIFPPDIHLVYEGYASAVYLREG